MYSPSSLLVPPSSKSPVSQLVSKSSSLVMVPPSLPIPPPLPKPTSTMARSLLAPFSSSAPPLFTTLCCVDPPQVLRSPAPPWQMDSSALPWAAEPITPPQPIDQLAPPWLLAPSGSPTTVVLTAPPGSFVPQGSALVQLSLCLHHRLWGFQLHLVPSPFRLRQASPSLRLALGPQSHQLRLSPAAP